MLETQNPEPTEARGASQLCHRKVDQTECYMGVYSPEDVAYKKLAQRSSEISQTHGWYCGGESLPAGGSNG